MAGRYERVATPQLPLPFLSSQKTQPPPQFPPTNNAVVQVNNQDDDAPTESLVTSRPSGGIPNSPPPSFRSRASSIAQRRPVDSTLEDAFDGDDSDDDADDRHCLVRSSTWTQPQTRAPEVTSRRTPPAAPLQTSGVLSNSGNQLASGRVYGGGMQADGVFSNLTAKPDRSGPEKEEQPPTYEQAAADSAPPYWETTILAPGMGSPDDVYIDGLPVGSLFSFVWNALISSSFQLVGFLLTYLLHTTHAAKNGSRAGLGITLIKYGFYMKNTPNTGGSKHGYANPPDPNSHDFNPNDVNAGDGDGAGSGNLNISGSEWVAYILMVAGWFILIRAVSDYTKARKHEQLVLQSPDRGLGVAVIAEGETPDRVV